MLRNDLQRLAQFAHEHDIQLWVDEVFRGITVDGGPVTPSIRDIDSGTISTGSMSKSFGLSGLRVGWIAAPEEVLEAFRHIRFYTTVTAPVVEQKIAAVAHRNRDKVIGRNQAILDKNYTYLKQWMGERNGVFDWVAPKGGPVTFPKFIDSVSTDDFCLKLAEDYSVLLPSGNYSFSAEGFIRIGYGQSRRFEEAMSRVGDALEEFLS
jgi:aspartate/methionine/tyrosine aminotransferase